MGYRCWIKGGELFLKDKSLMEETLDYLWDNEVDAESDELHGKIWVFGSAGDNYRSEYYEALCDVCDTGYLDFIGEDDSVWSLVFNDSKMDEVSGSIEWKHEEGKCCLCGNPIDGYGNDPWPVSTAENARCCDTCNAAKVIPARLKLLNYH